MLFTYFLVAVSSIQRFFIKLAEFIKALLEIPMTWRKSLNHVLATFLIIGNKKLNAMYLN